MMELLSDADLMDAVYGLDSGINLSSENKVKFLKFMNHPAVKKFIDTEVATWGSEKALSGKSADCLVVWQKISIL